MDDSRPPSPKLVAVTDSIRNDPEPDVEMLPTTSHDVPGPSSTFFPPPVDDSMAAGEQREREEEPVLPSLDDDDDDEVVSTLPVYLSSTLPLSMFQYPLHHRSLAVPQWAADRGKRITSRVKENAGRVEIEVPVDGGQNVWRDERARELGFVGDGRDDKWGDKVRLRSEVVPVGEAQFAGLVHEGALHLHPVSKVLQFRTAMQYLDEHKEEKKRKDVKLDDTNDGSGSIKDFRNKMWATAIREDEDRWVGYEWCAGEDARVVESLERLLLPSDKRTMLECRSRGLDYLDRER